MNKLNLTKVILLLFFVACFTNCSNESVNQEIERASITVKLFDAPGDFEKVYVEIVDVLLLTIDDKSAPNCWLSLNAKGGVYNLLDLTGGVEALLVEDLKIPAGMIYELKLVLGENNSIVTNGKALPLFTPFSHQKGLEMRIDQNLKNNMSYTFLIDFDVEQSILKTSTPDYFILSPELRFNIEVLSGSIQGKISNTLAQTKISIISETKHISTFTDSDGNFVLKGIPSGSYSIQITPDAKSGYSGMTVNDLKVSVGKVTEVGIIELK